MPESGRRLLRTPREEALRALLLEAQHEDIRIDAGDEAQRLLDWAARASGANPADYHAVTIGDAVFARPDYADNVRVLREELIHVYQQRAGASSGDIVEHEIAARLQMVRSRHRWGITNNEVREMIWEVREMRRRERY